MNAYGDLQVFVEVEKVSANIGLDYHPLSSGDKARPMHLLSGKSRSMP